jgi:6-pyruvoyltetrahydropterin/6-carboxytetrahydropterin synthase
MATHSVSVEGIRLRFAAAHMATFHGDCEPLHGHNYVVSVEAEGDLTDDSWVWDFGDLKRMTKDILDEMDHRFLLQRESRVLTIEEGADEWTITFGGRRYVFPASDVAVLPIDNSTAERIAEYIAGRLIEAFRSRQAATIARLRVGVEEMPGQSGWYMIDVQERA